MRSNPITNLLVGLVALTVVATAGLTIYYVRLVQKLNVLQLQAAVINRNRTLATSLVNDAVEYSKHNPALEPILQSIGIKAKAGAAGPSGPTNP